MKLRECATLIVLGLLAAIGLIGYASSFFLGDDNPVEESCEEVIEKGTGADIDLTPNSPENSTPNSPEDMGVMDSSSASDLCDIAALRTLP
jgi:hypothetical protein